jgi:hypothetical protein
MPLIVDERPPAKAQLRTSPANSGVVSWNTSAPRGALAVRVRFEDETWSEWLPYVRWDPKSRASLGGRDERAHFDVDLLRATQRFSAIEIESTAELDAVALATPPSAGRRDVELEPIELDVPMRSQYVGDSGRGWCSPASLAMLLGANGVNVDVPHIAASIFDDAYGGTGNWTFNVAFASRFRFRAFVAFLRDLVQARLLIAAGVPVALSIAWKKDELDSPPLEESDGHIVVLRGFDAAGNPIVNDPAQATIRTVYPREQFEKVWLGHGGIAYVVAPPHKPSVELANA